MQWIHGKRQKTIWTDEFWIQFEICDDGYKDEAYFKRAYNEACEFTAYICELYGIDPHGTVIFNGIEVPTILCHADSYNLGLGSNHSDVYSWFKKFGCDMTTVRNDVAALMNKTTVQPEPDVAFNKGDIVKLKSGVVTFYNGTKMASWVPKATFYVRDIKANNLVTVSTLKEGDVTGTVFASNLILVQSAKAEEQPNQNPIADEIADTIIDKNQNNDDTIDNSADTSNETAIDDKALENEKESDDIQQSKKAKNAAAELLNRIVGFVTRFFRSNILKK